MSEDLIQKAERLLEEAKSLPAPIIKVTKTNTIIMHYVQLPVVDLAFRFLYRFEEPVATVWRKGAISHSMIGVPIDSQEALKEYALQQWYKLVTADMKGPMPEDVQWMLEVDRCTLVRCEIKPI